MGRLRSVQLQSREDVDREEAVWKLHWEPRVVQPIQGGLSWRFTGYPGKNREAGGGENPVISPSRSGNINSKVVRVKRVKKSEVD